MPTRPDRRDAPPAADAEPATLADQAYAQLKAMIFDFALMPGDRVSESELAQRIEVSRTPLRQALQRLEREGFLQVFPKLGWRVAPLDFDVFDELYDFRILIESHAVQVLAEAEPRPGLQALTDTWLVPAEARRADAAEVGRLDIRIIRRLDFTQPARIEATYDEHARVLRAIVRRRGDEARRLLRAHIEQSKLEVRHITLDMLYRLRRRA
jgi:DNA-binding GntR family transcriptional regulator